MILFQAQAVPKQLAAGLGAQEISSPGSGSSSQASKLFQEAKNSPWVHLGGASGTSADSQVVQ